MARILVFHPMIMAGSGAGTVCVNIIEALESDHDVTLLTTGSPTIDQLNRYYGTNITSIGVKSCRFNPVLKRIPGTIARFKSDLLSRAFRWTRLSSYDLVIVTRNELPDVSGMVGDPPILQYVHYPSSLEHPIKPVPGIPMPLVRIYHRCCEQIGPTIDQSAIDHVYNSNWTATNIDASFDDNPRVLYPPVRTADIETQPWEDRRDEIVTVGRVSSEKRLHETIDVVMRLRERGHDVDYRLIGPTPSGLPVPFRQSYSNSVRSRAAELDFVHFEGPVSRERLIDLLTIAKYGFHGRSEEHFGIAIAEIIAAGCLPFVPRGGGQQEVVGHCEECLFDTWDGAVDAMDAAMQSADHRERIRQKLPDVEAQFGCARFQQELNALVSELLSASIDGTG